MDVIFVNTLRSSGNEFGSQSAVPFRLSLDTSLRKTTATRVSIRQTCRPARTSWPAAPDYEVPN